MLLDPVGITDIATKAGVRPDTVKKWIDRHDHFPRPRGTAGRGRLWEWAEVHRWLVATRRAPHTIRYREFNGPGALEVLVLDGDDQWQAVAHFWGSSGAVDWTATPTRLAIETVGGDRAAAQEWADRLLAGWDEARARWVREHPDEPMPTHLAGANLHELWEPEAEAVVAGASSDDPSGDWVWLAERA